MSKKILLIEDEKAQVKALTIKIQKEGFELLVSNNGEDGLKMAIKEHPDLILLDVIMPLMNGIEMLKKLREDSWGKDAKVVMLTNLDTRTSQHDIATQEQVYDYLVKANWSINDLMDKIHEVLGE